MQIQPYSPLQPGQPQPQPIPLTYYSPGGYESEEVNLRQVLGVFRRRAWVVAGVAVAVTTAIWSWTLTRTPIYQSGFQVQIEPVTNLNKSEVMLFGNPSNVDYATQIEVLRSPQILAPIVEKLQKSYPGISVGDLAVGLGIRQITDSEGRPTKILAVDYRDRNPQKVKDILDRVAEGYIQYSIELRQTSLQQGVQFVETQLPDLRRRVGQLQKELERFRQRYSLVDPEARGGDLSSQISALERQQQETQAELTEAQSLFMLLQRQVGAGPDQAFASAALSESSRYQTLLSQLRQIETQIATESTRFQPNSPNIQVLVSKRNSLLPLMEQEAQRALGSAPTPATNANLPPIALDLNKQLVGAGNRIQGLQVRLQALAVTQANLKRQFELVPSLARQYTDLQRELSIATESLNRFLATRENLQLEAAQRALPWQLLIAPGLPQVPIAPNIPRNLTVGVIAGLLLGIGTALLVEKLDNVFHSANDLKDKTRLPLLGIIPYSRGLREIGEMLGISRLPQQAGADLTSPLSDRPAARSRGERSANALATYHSSPFLDSFRSLYTNIRFLSSDESIHSIVVGSAVPADGKSTVAVYLAQAAAAMGQRVLLVDADLRRPQVNVVLGIPNLRGLSNIISSDVAPHEVIQQSPLDENLFVITAGQIPPDPTKLLASRKMQSLVEHFREQFDMVIYDTPPLLGLADSSLLGTHTDGIVLVVGLGRTDRSALMQALDGLKVSAVPILGMVANGVESYASSDYYKAYYRRYYMQRPEETPTT